MKLKRIALRALPLDRRLRLFQSIVPRRFWFTSVLTLCRVHGVVAGLAGLRERARYEAEFLDCWLENLTHRGSFRIQYRANGAHHLQRTDADEAGLLICSMHVPLTPVMVRGWLDAGAAPDFVIAAPHSIQQGNRWNPSGLARGCAAFPPGTAAVLRTRTVLREGGRVGVMLDEDFGTPLRPHMMRLAGRVRARVVLSWAEMDANGIAVNYLAPPHPVPDTEEKVLANLAVMEKHRDRIIAGLRARRWGPAWNDCPAIAD